MVMGEWPQVFSSLIERLQSLERVVRSIGDARSADRLEADIAKLKRIHAGKRKRIYAGKRRRGKS